MEQQKHCEQCENPEEDSCSECVIYQHFLARIRIKQPARDELPDLQAELTEREAETKSPTFLLKSKIDQMFIRDIITYLKNEIKNYKHRRK